MIVHTASAHTIYVDGVPIGRITSISFACDCTLAMCNCSVNLSITTNDPIWEVRPDPPPRDRQPRPIHRERWRVASGPPRTYRRPCY